MQLEIQIALNYVINFLYNKLPRRRVNIFGEELEKALKDKFQGHWYPEKPFKGSAFRCIKTGDPIDAVLERAAKESGVPIADILENLPNELSVWVDPGEVSYRIGEKGAVKILYSYSENNENHDDNTSADREVTKTFNPEAQCFRPIDAVNTTMNGLNISPKTSPNNSGSSPASSTSPTYKGSPNPAGSAFLPRTQAQLTFTTATFAQTKFGSTKLKTNSKRNNSNGSNNTSFRMSPTEFSNYIKQRQIQQQIHHSHGQPVTNNHFGPIGPVSPSRSLSPNPLGMGGIQNSESFYFNNMGNNGIYQQFNNGGHRNIFGNIGDGNNHYHQQQPQQTATQFSQFMEQSSFFVNGGLNSGNLNNNAATTPTHKSNNNGMGVIGGSSGPLSPTSQQQSMSPIPNSDATQSSSSSSSSSTSSTGSNSKLIDGLNSFYSTTAGPYQHLLVAN